MTKTRRKRAGKRKPAPITLPQGDIGPDTAAQRAGAVILCDKEAGVTRLRKRRDHILEMMSRGTRRRPAMITRRQCAAGMELAERYDQTWFSPDLAWTRVYVDSSPRPGDVNVKQLEAKARYAALIKLVPRECLGVVRAVCCFNLSIRPGFTGDPNRVKEHLRRLRTGLDAIADELGI